MTTSKAIKKTPTIVGLLMAALLLFPFILPGGAAEATSEIERSIPSVVGCGTTVSVVLHVQWGDAETVLIEEDYPAGWTVESTSHGANTGDDGKVKWFLNDPVISQVTYTLELPTDAEGTFSFTGAFRDDSMSSTAPDRSITGDGSLAVACPSAEVTRAELPAMTCGETYTIRINIEWHETDKHALAIEEHPPAGWGITEASNGGNLSSAGMVKWFLNQTDVTQITYQVAVPSDAAGAHPFSGDYRDDGMGKEGPSALIGGDDETDVSCGADVTRSGLSQQQCGETFTVTLSLGWSGTDSMFIEESYPAGWTVISRSNGGSLESDGMVKWFLNDPAIVAVTYELAIPSQAAGTYAFSGEFRDDTMGSEDASKETLGQDGLAVSCGSSNPPPPEDGAHAQRNAPGTLHPQSTSDQSVLVSLSITWNDATAVDLREDIPGPNVLISQISNGGAIVGGVIQWSLSDPSVSSVSYRISTPSSSDLSVFGGRTFSGTVMDDVKAAEAAIMGTADFRILHRFDATNDCKFADNDLFTVIDAWKAASATDNELFSGIDAWKKAPSSYCSN